jgi:hypothetical protein
VLYLLTSIRTVTNQSAKSSKAVATGGRRSASGCTLENEGWRVDNNPGYWGAADPKVLILGFSKGANQRSTRPFNEIAFHNARSNLAEILNALDLLEVSADIDACFTSAEPKLGFASVVRCGLGKAVENGKYATSGDVVRSAISPNSVVRRFFDGCTARFLGNLPQSVHVVVFLGLDRPYVEALFERVRELHPSLRRLSNLAYATESITFVHVIHPSPLATSHRQAWLRDDASSLAAKRREVHAALCKLPQYAPHPKPKTPPPSRSRPSNAAELESASTRPAVSESKVEDLIEMVRSAIKQGYLDAEVIGNLRTDEDTDPKKLFRIRRADGEEFAIQRSEKDFRIWSSVEPSGETPLAAPAEEYFPMRNRHSNLGCMPKLRGPTDSAPGVRAWKLRFHTPIAALNFIA